MADPKNISESGFKDTLKDFEPVTKSILKDTRDVLQAIDHPADSTTKLSGLVVTIVNSGLGLITIIIGLIFQLFTPLIVRFLKIASALRRDTIPEQLQISTEIVGELTGVDISPAHVKTGKNVSETAAAQQAIGAAFLGALEKQFAPSGTATPQSGAAAAATFTGFGINFGIQEAMLATIFEAVPWHLVQGMAELAPDIAKNIGLGRLVRQSLRPLVQETIGTPYTKLLKAKYRQDTLSESQLVQAQLSGLLTPEYVKGELAKKGYPDELINIIISELTPTLSDSEYERLIRYGATVEDLAQQGLRPAGLPNFLLQSKLRAAQLARVDSVVATYVSTLRSQVATEFLSIEDFQGILSTLPLSQEERDWQIRIAAQKLEVPRRRPTLAQVRKLLEEAIVDLNYVDDWLASEGYSDDDALNILLLELNIIADDKAKEAAAKAKKDAAAARAARKAAGGV